MKKSKFKRSISFLLAFIICLSTFTGLGITASAAGVKGKSYMVSFPRENDAKADYSGTWGHGDLSYMNGWSGHTTKYTTFFTIDEYGGKICYCIEPGTPAENGNEFTQKDESFWDNYPDKYNKTIDADTIKLLIGRILQYGFTGDVSLDWVSQNQSDANNIAKAYATQILIWETIVGERDENFAHVDTGKYDRILQIVRDTHPLKSLIYSYYNSMPRTFKSIPNYRVFVNAAPARQKKLNLNGTDHSI